MCATPVLTREVMGTMVSGEVPAKTRRRGAMVGWNVKGKGKVVRGIKWPSGYVSSLLGTTRQRQVELDKDSQGMMIYVWCAVLPARTSRLTCGANVVLA